MGPQIGCPSPPQSAPPLHALWRLCIVFYCHSIGFPIVKIVFKLCFNLTVMINNNSIKSTYSIRTELKINK